MEPCLQIPYPKANGAISMCDLTPLLAFTTSKGHTNIVSEQTSSSMKEGTQGVCENAAEDSEAVNLDLSYKVTSTVMDKPHDDIFTKECTKPLDILHRYALFDDIATKDVSKEEFLHVFIALVSASCKLCPLEVRKNFLWNMFKPKLTAMIISYSPLVNVKLGKATSDKIEELKQNAVRLFERMWEHWTLKLTVENSLDDIGTKELNVGFLTKSMDFLENLVVSSIDLIKDKDALWSAQYQIVCSSLPTAWLLPAQSSCHNMRRIIKSHFRCPNLSDIGIYEAVTKVTNCGAVDYSSSCFILVSQNLFQVTILNSKSKAALLGLQFVMSSVTLESLILEFDKSGSMFMDHVIMALGDALLECNHWIVEWAKDKSGWEELLKYDSEFNQHVLVRNVIAHAQLNVETLLDEMGHTRVLGLHIFLDEVHVIFLELDLAIKCANHHRLSNNHFYLVLIYAITSIPKRRAFFKDCVTGKGTILEVLTILLSDLGLVEIQNHKFSSSESRIIQYIMGISVIMKFEDYIATTIQEMTSLRLLTVHLVLVLFALLKCHLGAKLESAKHGSLVLKFLKAIILYCSHIRAEIQACVWFNLLQLVDFFVNGDEHWNVLQRFMEFKFMILGKDTTSELTVWQDAVVENHQQYLGNLNARYLLKLSEVISVEEFRKTVSFGVSSEEIIDFLKIISESYCFWVFEVDTKVFLATLGIAEVMYLLPLEHQTECLEQVVARKEVSDLLQVHYLLKDCSQIGFDGNRGSKKDFAGHKPILFLDLQLCHGNLATVRLALCLNQGYYSFLTVQYKSVMIGLSTEPTLEWFIKQKTLFQVITRARGENEELLLLNVTLIVLGFSAYSDAHCDILLHILAGFCFSTLYSIEVRIAGMLTTLIVDWLWQVLFLLTNGESNSVESTWQSKPKTHSISFGEYSSFLDTLLTFSMKLLNQTIFELYEWGIIQFVKNFNDDKRGEWGYLTYLDVEKVTLCLSFDDKPGVSKVTMIAELVHIQDDLLHYLRQRAIILSIFYFGFISSLSNYGCFWYNILGAAFDDGMTLKLLSIVDSAHGTSLKTFGMSLHGMRTCLKLRGRDC